MLLLFLSLCMVLISMWQCAHNFILESRLATFFYRPLFIIVGYCSHICMVACRNVKTRWLSMLAPATRLMNEYKPVLAKLHQDVNVKKPKKHAEKCYLGLRDLQVVLRLACLMPMLQGANVLMKYAQQTNIFMYDSLGAVRQLQTQINKQYVEEISKYT